MPLHPFTSLRALFLIPALCALLAACATASGPATTPQPLAAPPPLPTDSAYVSCEGLSLPLSIVRPSKVTADAVLPTVIYLANLSSPRTGTEPDSILRESFLAQGCQVVTIDFQAQASARIPALNQELARIRSLLHSTSWLAGIRPDKSRIYIVPSGCRLLRDVPYWREADGGRILAMDLIFPAKPAAQFGAILEFSCDNRDRYGNYSLHACSDTLIDSLASEGFAVAMADHPVAAPYKGLDAMPVSGRKIRAALHALRAALQPHGHSGKVAPVGFSRGSGMALMLATTAGQGAWDGFGEVASGRSDVQGAVILSGRFTYLDLLPADHMIPRYDKAWGPRAANEEVWRAHGALDLWDGSALPSLFLSINCTESPDALHQMAVLRRRLEAKGQRFEYHLDATPRGHKVPLDPAILKAMTDYLHRQLD